jgi:hypothetical protein
VRRRARPAHGQGRDGAAVEVEPNFAAACVHPGGGKVCVKAYGLVQKTYHPAACCTR